MFAVNNIKDQDEIFTQISIIIEAHVVVHVVIVALHCQDRQDLSEIVLDSAKDICCVMHVVHQYKRSRLRAIFIEAP